VSSPIGFGDARIPARVWEKLIVDNTTQCWTWTGCIAAHPQVRWKVDGKWKVMNARRVFTNLLGIETEAIGSDQPTCCNPAHFHYGSSSEISKHWNEVNRKTHCVNGHEYAVEGVYYGISRGVVVRRCRACHYIQTRRWINKKWKRKLARWKPERRKLYWKRRATLRELWAKGIMRRPDGSIPPVSAVP
jgi:hypothetical protein